MIVKDAFHFIVPLMISAVAAFALGRNIAGVSLVLISAFVAFFFRNPRRKIPADPRTIVSPADGRVVRVQREGDVTRLSIFLSLFNVHVNRSPIGGRIEAVQYHKGSFKAAFKHAASVENERNVVTVSDGRVRITFVQIAGVVARRIVFWKKRGDSVEKGELVGLIRFGSRVDVLFPPGTSVIVGRGARVRGGSTPIGIIGDGNENGHDGQTA
jgi:phosphatidylserine decarboxylase